MITPTIKGVTFLGTATPTHKGPQAALLHGPLPRSAIERVYAVLPKEARMHILLAKRWNLHGVLATDSWVATRGRRSTPPTIATEAKLKEQEEVTA